VQVLALLSRSLLIHSLRFISVLLRVSAPAVYQPSNCLYLDPTFIQQTSNAVVTAQTTAHYSQSQLLKIMGASAALLSRYMNVSHSFSSLHSATATSSHNLTFLILVPLVPFLVVADQFSLDPVRWEAAMPPSSM
jgi:hypothetical protein